MSFWNEPMTWGGYCSLVIGWTVFRVAFYIGMNLGK